MIDERDAEILALRDALKRARKEITVEMESNGIPKGLVKSRAGEPNGTKYTNQVLEIVLKALSRPAPSFAKEMELMRDVVEAAITFNNGILEIDDNDMHDTGHLKKLREALNALAADQEPK